PELVADLAATGPRVRHMSLWCVTSPAFAPRLSNAAGAGPAQEPKVSAFRQRERKLATRSELGRHRHLPAVRLDDAFRNRQTEAGALRLPVTLPEALEQVRDVVVGNARPGVAHLDANVCALGHDFDGDASASRRELDRVAHQIREHLQDA